MTAEEHNKYLGIAHLVYGGIHTLMGLAMAILFSLMFRSFVTGGPMRGDGPPAGLIFAMAAFIMLFSLLFSVPSFIASYGLLKRKTWAKTAGLIAGGIAAMNMPFGTALCVYSFWFLLGEGGKELYAKSLAQGTTYQREALYGAGQQYILPPQPPNWRD